MKRKVRHLAIDEKEGDGSRRQRADQAPEKTPFLRPDGTAYLDGRVRSNGPLIRLMYHLVETVRSDGMGNDPDNHPVR